MSEHAENSPSQGSVAATLPRPVRRPALKQPRLWNVVLLNDEEHTYDYVIEMVQRVFGAPIERAFKIAQTVDTEGRAVCGTFHKELAELKLDQITACGRDARIASCNGPMSALIEPADSGEDE